MSNVNTDTLPMLTLVDILTRIEKPRNPVHDKIIKLDQSHLDVKMSQLVLKIMRDTKVTYGRNSKIKTFENLINMS